MLQDGLQIRPTNKPTAIRRLTKRREGRGRRRFPGAAASLVIVRRGGYLNSTLVAEMTILSPSFLTVPTTVPSLASVQISLWNFLLEASSNQ